MGTTCVPSDSACFTAAMRASASNSGVGFTNKCTTAKPTLGVIEPSGAGPGTEVGATSLMKKPYPSVGEYPSPGSVRCVTHHSSIAGEPVQSDARSTSGLHGQ